MTDNNIVFFFEISIRFWKATSYVFCSLFHDISKSSCVQHLEKVIVSSSIISKSWRIWSEIRYQQRLLWSSYDRSIAWSKTYCWIYVFANVERDMNLYDVAVKGNLVCTDTCMRNDCKNCSNEELIINKESWYTSW